MIRPDKSVDHVTEILPNNAVTVSFSFETWHKLQHSKLEYNLGQKIGNRDSLKFFEKTAPFVFNKVKLRSQLRVSLAMAPSKKYQKLQKSF